MAQDVEIPTYRELMYPTLVALNRLGGSADIHALDAAVIEVAGLSSEQLAVEFDAEQTQTGSVLLHRTAFTRTHLKKAGLVDNPERGRWELLEPGHAILAMSQEEAKEALFDADRQTRRDHDPQSDSSEPGKPPGSPDSNFKDEIGRAFPNATDRRAFVTAMADAILTAHEVNPLSWSLSGRKGLALNVGKNSSLATTPQAMFVATGTQDALVEELLSVGITATAEPYAFPESVHWISLPDGASFAEGFAPLRDNFLETIAATAVHKTRHWRSFSEEGAAYLEAELGIELPRPPQLTASQHDELPYSGGTLPSPAIPAIHLEAERLMRRTGQMIFYGPPGTGKTYNARRHAVWLLSGGSANPDAARAFGSAVDFKALEDRYSSAITSDERPSWLLVANPKRWSWAQLFEEGTTDYAYGQMKRNYPMIEAGDAVYGYEASPTRAIVAKASVLRGLHDTTEGQKILIHDGTPVEGPSWETLKNDPILSQSEPMVHNMQGTLFRLEPAEAARIDELSASHTGSRPASRPVPQLTRVTFHPTYAYEDFIEGYKPTESGAGGLELEMRDGLFKKVCRAAAADPDRSYVIVIDEINRGNVPKIFGELITLLEMDKRGVSVTLPQSGDSFVVPPNVRLIATMNTADRSIHILDSALRRRFAFVELLPDPTVLEGSQVGTLPLDEFLRELNVLIRDRIGREKQIGHSLVMNGETPISSTREFALAFKYELLPLLQEYAYGDYRELATLVGDDVIDVDNQVPRSSVIDDGQQLITALAKHLEISLT